MKKNILIMAIGILLVVSMSNLVNAEINYWQIKLTDRTPINVTLYNTTTIHSVIAYDRNTDDYIKGGSPLEFYVWYDVYIDTWNNLNPDYSVDYCNFTVRTHTSGTPDTSVDYTNLFTEDYRNAKYFVRLENGDTFFVDMDCHFNGTNTSLLVPANVQIVMPTWECKECQYYEWSVTERNIVKAKEIGNNVVDVTDKIKGLIELNYELWLALFWIVLIIIAVHSTALIFVGLVWAFAFLKNMIK